MKRLGTGWVGRMGRRAVRGFVYALLPASLRAAPPRFVAAKLGGRPLRPFFDGAASVYRRLVLRSTPIVAVIGSFGKTTTRAAVVAAIEGRPREQWANAGSRIALGILAHRPGRPLVIEVGITKLGQMRPHARLLRPSIVVLTSIGSEHHRSFGDLETTQREKGEMVAVLPPGGLLVANGDDPRVLEMVARRPPGTRCVLFGWGPDNHVRGEDVALDWPRGSTLTVTIAGQRVAARSGLIGPDNLRAILAAVAVAGEMGVDPALAVERLTALRPPIGRMQPVALDSGAVLLRDDYKSPIETIDSALAVFATVPARRRFVVLGAISEPQGPSTQLYRGLGERAGRVADRMLCCAEQEALARGARRALPAAAVTRHRSVHEAARVLAAELQPGDAVLIKGRVDQKLGRIAILLGGREVRCTVTRCPAGGLICERCSQL